MKEDFILSVSALIFSSLILSFPIRAPAISVCQEVFKQISAENTRAMNSLAAGPIVDILGRIAAKRQSYPTHQKLMREAAELILHFNEISTRHLNLLKPSEEGETIHRMNDGNPLTSDHVFVLRLPKPGVKTVWSQLNPGERETLIWLIKEVFQKANYDRRIIEEREKQRYGSALAQSIQVIDNFNNNKGAGLVPLFMLEAARKGKEIGMCGHGNCALVGILYELGATPQNVRVVSGFSDVRKTKGHAWFEYRTTSTGKWNEDDATPQSQDVWTRLLRDHGSLSNRKKYSYHLKVHDEFFEGTFHSMY